MSCITRHLATHRLLNPPDESADMNMGVLTNNHDQSYTHRSSGDLPMKRPLRALLSVAALSFIAGYVCGLSRDVVSIIQPAQATPPAHQTRPNPQTNRDAHTRFLRAVDGDTLELLYQPRTAIKEKVRLLRINTPERDEPGYLEARKALQQLTAHRTLSLEFETPDQPKRDRYGRLLAYVIADGVNVNIEMVRLGWSTYWTKYGRSRYEPAFQLAQRSARAARRGLWAQHRNQSP